MRSIHLVTICAVWLLATACPTQAASVSDSVTFTSRDQALFGAKQGQEEAGKTITLGSLPLFHDARGPVTDGEIYRLEQPIPVEAAQAIWQRAIDACRTRITRTQRVRVTLPVVGSVSRSCRGSVTPTQAQCISGGSINPRLSATCCIHGGTYPNCTNRLGPDTATVSTSALTFNVGAGIGPRPTTGTDRPYDIGLVATMTSDITVGLEGVLELDPGTLDVVYPTTFHVVTDTETEVAGGVFTVFATHVPGRPELTSEYPNISLALNTYTQANVRLDLDYAAIDYSNGNQIRSTFMVDAYSTADDPAADDQGRIITPIFEAKAGIGAGLQVLVNTDVAIGGVEAQLLDPIDPFVLPLEFTYDVTNPPEAAPFCDVFPRPDCNTNPPVSTDIVEMLFRTPLLDTPAVAGFNGGTDFTGVAGADVPIEQARNQLLADGSVRNTTVTGKRDALESSLEAVGGDLTKLTISDGLVDTDLIRLGVDIDGSLSGFGLPPGGLDVQLPPQLPETFFIPQLRGKRLLEVEANLIDLDAVDYLYFDQELIFRPNLAIELVFDKPVMVRVAGSGEDFALIVPNDDNEYVQKLEVSADGWSAVEVIQPADGVQITPRYTIAGNVFENNLDWLVNSGIQGTVGQLNVGGVVATLIAPIFTGISGAESLNFALGQFAPSFDEPIRIPAHEEFNVGGFGDPISGTTISVAIGAPAPTATGSPLVAGTFTPTLTPTPIPPTATPIVILERADANCDLSLTAADLPALLSTVGDQQGPCGSSDINDDGTVDALDVDLLIQLMFE